MAAVTSLARHAASLATSASSREPRRSKVHRAMEWPKPSSARSSVTMSASVRVRMQTPSCSSYQFGSLTTTRFTRTRHSDIVHPVSSSQLTEARDRVRSFGGYNRTLPIERKGIDLIQVPNYLHVMMLAEPGWVIPAGKYERRYAALEVSSVRRGDKSYFRALHRQINEGGAEAMFYDLQRMELGDWHPRDIPETLLRNPALLKQQGFN